MKISRKQSASLNWSLDEALERLNAGGIVLIAEDRYKIYALAKTLLGYSMIVLSKRTLEVKKFQDVSESELLKELLLFLQFARTGRIRVAPRLKELLGSLTNRFVLEAL